MPIDVSFEGRTYPPTEPYAVGREAVRAFAAAVGADSPLHHDVTAARAAGYADVVAPPTFAVVLAQRAEAQYVADPASGIDFSRVVHAEERFELGRPIVAGQELVAVLHVERAREVGDNAMIGTRVDLYDAPAVATVLAPGSTGGAEGDAPEPAATDDPVASVTSTIVVRGEGS